MNKEEAIKTRKINFVFSDETKDAHGTVLPVDGWVLDRFEKNGIAFFNHNSYSSDPDQAIGTARAWIENGKLVGYIQFEKEEVNPLAEKVFKKVLGGTYKTVSVGFLPLERGSFGKGDEAAGEKNETYYYGKRELLEISIAPIPSNKNALVRSLGDDPLAEKMERSCVFGDIDVVENEEDENENEDDFNEFLDEVRVIEANAGAVITKALC